MRKLGLPLAALLWAAPAFANTYWQYPSGTVPSGSEVIGPAHQNGQDVSLSVSQLWTFLARGSSFPRILLDRFQGIQDPRDFGDANTCNGTGDDTTAVNAALTAAATHPWLSFAPSGGVVRIDSTEKCNLSSNITIPTGVRLEGEFRAAGYPALGTAVNPPYAALGSKITLSGGAHIILSSMASIEGLIIQRSGITYLESDSSAFANTAITTLTNANDIRIENNGIFGFNLGFDGTNGPARVRIFNNNMDNIYDVQIYGSGDINKIYDNSFYPFVTCSSQCSNPNGATTGLFRSGTAITLENQDPGTIVQNNMIFSYQIGIYLQAVDSELIKGNYCDGAGSSCVTVSTGTNSTYIEENYGLNKTNTFNINPISGDIHLSHNFSAFSTGSAYNFSSGTIYSDHDDTFTGSGGLLGSSSLNTIGMNLGSSTNAIIDHPSFRGIQTGKPDIQSPGSGSGTVIITNKSTDKSIGDPSVTGYVASPSSIACAEPLSIPQVGNVFTITGSCSVTTIQNATVDRQITLLMSGTPTLVNGTYMKLSGGTNWTPGSTGASITFVGNGTAWVEIGRKQ